MERLTFDNNGVPQFTREGMTMYCSSMAMADCVYELENRLAAYEEAEEQGLLVRLPCKVETPVYFIKKTGFHPELIETRIDEIGVRRGGMFVKLSCNSMYRTAISAWGKTVFLTREEAEAALAKEG